MTTTQRFLIAVLTCLLMSWSEAQATECDPGICVGTPCTIVGIHDLSSGCVLDFGAQDVTLAKNAQLSESAGGGFTLRAHHLTIAGVLRTKFPSGGFDAGPITVEATGDFTTPSGTPGRVFSQGTGGGFGGPVSITAVGDVNLRGQAGVSSQPAGTIDIIGASVLVAEKVSALTFGSVEIRSTSGPVTITKAIKVDTLAPGIGCGADVTIAAQGGDLLIDGPVSQTNRCGAGSLSFFATGDVVVDAPITASDKFQGDGGGFIAIRAGGNLEVNAPITTNGSPYLDFASPGGRVLLSADGAVIVNHTIRANAVDGAGAGCIGVSVGPGQTIAINGRLEAKAPTGFGGAIILGDAPHDIAAFPDCNAPHPGPVVGAGAVSVSNVVDSQGEDGLTRISYATSFDGTGASLLSGPTSTDSGNLVQCGCVDANADDICDGGCIAAPTGLNPAKVTPPIQLVPTVLAP